MHILTVMFVFLTVGAHLLDTGDSLPAFSTQSPSKLIPVRLSPGPCYLQGTIALCTNHWVISDMCLALQGILEQILGKTEKTSSSHNWLSGIWPYKGHQNSVYKVHTVSVWPEAWGGGPWPYVMNSEAWEASKEGKERKLQPTPRIYAM